MDAADDYVSAATEYGRCTETGDFRTGNAAFARLTAALAQLRLRPDRGEEPLVKLLTHPNGWVKSNAATHLLPLRPELAVAILENLAEGPQGHLAFDAKMVLQEWQAGRLNVP